MTKKYQIYGIGAALVDTEIVVNDAFLSTHKIDKGLMTLVDEERQFELLGALNSHSFHVKRSCGGSACNSIVAASCLYSRKSILGPNWLTTLAEASLANLAAHA